MAPDILRDLRYAVRSLLRQPAFTATVLLTLAVGIGLTTAMFSIVHALLLKRLPFDEANRLMAVQLLVADPRFDSGATRPIVWSFPKYRTFRELQTIYQNAGLYRRERWNLTGTGAPERLTGEQVTGSYFATLGARPHLGRLFTAEEDQGAGIAPVAILGHALWTRLYGRDSNVIGRSIELSGRSHEIVGVLPPGFRGLTGASAVWVPVTTMEAEFLKSLIHLLETPTGVRAENVLTVRLALPIAQYGQGRAIPFVEQLLERVRALPGVRAAGINICAPVSNACNGTVLWFRDRPEVPKGTEPAVGAHFVSPGYFETLGIPLERGRLFDDSDRAGRPKVVLVSAQAARRLWPGDDPIGRPVAVGMGGFGDGAEVIGVVGDVRYEAIEDAPQPDVYLPLLQSPRTSFLLFVRTTGRPVDLLPAVRAAVLDLDPNLPVTDAKTMAEWVGNASARTRLAGGLLAVFAAVAVLLAGIGVSGATAYLVEQRTREIGIRMALGADRGAVGRLVLSRGVGMALAGVAMGLVGAFWLLRFLEGLLYEVTPGDPAALVAASAVLVLAAALASVVPAARAARVDPLVALRAE